MYYRYLGSHALNTLKEQRMLTSKISTFNDPFEFQFATKDSYSTKDVKDSIRYQLTQETFCRQYADSNGHIDMPTLIKQMNSPEFVEMTRVAMPDWEKKY